MRVKLPRSCSGAEIVDAFKAAATFDEGENRWKAYEIGVTHQYEPGSVRQTIRSKGAETFPSYLRKKWIFFGKKVWKPNAWKTFRLNPVMLSDTYSEVEIAVEYIYNVDQGGFQHVATNPNHPQFEDIRPQFERIIGGLYAGLQLQGA